MRLASYRLALAGGLGLLAYGVSMWSLAAGLVIGGACVAGGGLAGIMGLEGSGGEG